MTLLRRLARLHGRRLRPRVDQQPGQPFRLVPGRGRSGLRRLLAHSGRVQFAGHPGSVGHDDLFFPFDFRRPVVQHRSAHFGSHDILPNSPRELIQASSLCFERRLKPAQIVRHRVALGKPLPLQPLQPFRRDRIASRLRTQLLDRQSSRGSGAAFLAQLGREPQPNGADGDPFASFSSARIMLGPQPLNFGPPPLAPAPQQRPPVILLGKQSPLPTIQLCPAGVQDYSPFGVFGLRPNPLGLQREPQLGGCLILRADRSPRRLQLAAAAIQVQFACLKPSANQIQVAQRRHSVGMPALLRSQQPFDLLGQVQPLIGQFVRNASQRLGAAP